MIDNRLGAIDAIAPSREKRRPAPPPPRDPWGDGDYAALGALLAPAADALAGAAGIAPGQCVLDAGGLAAAAGRRGATVVARDPGVSLADDSFDCVASCFGAVHAPDQPALTAELRRVVRPGGVLALAAWESVGVMAGLLSAAARVTGHPGTRQAARWGRYEHAYRALGFLDGFEVDERELTLEVSSADELWGPLTAPGGPLAAAGEDASFRREFDAAVEHHARGTADGIAITAGYVLITAREPAAS